MTGADETNPGGAAQRFVDRQIVNPRNAEHNAYIMVGQRPDYCLATRHPHLPAVGLLLLQGGTIHDAPCIYIACSQRTRVMDEKEMKDDHPQATGDHHPARLSTVDELMTFGIDLLTAVGASPADQAGRQPGNGAQRHGVHVNWTVDQPWAGGLKGAGQYAAADL